MIKVTYTENTDINVDFTSVQSLKIRYTAIERIVETTAIPTHFVSVFKNFDRLGFITLILLLLYNRLYVSLPEKQNTPYSYRLI